MSELKSRKPANTAFKQQRLKAWQPLLTPKTVLPTLFAAGIILAPLGGLFLYESETVNEIVIDYTHCDSATSLTTLGDNLYSYKFTSDNTTTIYAPQYVANSTQTFMDNSTIYGGPINRCTIQFSIPIELKPPIFVYYKLTNFYQNHRKYVKSLDQSQLAGDNVTPSQAQASCNPVGVDANNNVIYPCGLIANSMFNDSFSNLTILNPGGVNVDNQVYFLNEKGIAWGSDVTRYKKTSMPPSSLTPPPNWIKRYPNYTEANLFDPSNEHFLVWMRTSWYPTFRKLYSRYDGPAPLSAGIYNIQVDLNYNIAAYGGTKSLVITGTSFLGDRNAFMGLAYIIMGCVCAFLGVVFLGWHFFRPRKLGDHDKLTWNQAHTMKQH
ncbi:Lem3/Cdc50 [Hesseltinella vesiculosa]|uniref:Lem3/Cdc50 n=1 Tax=Hesseltinella vesiculosa TaxID=101127 RepID=A0A1X2G999_9FUNG|nr:Lem3/Cdc50 [Hesseltinella vesiculosa]